MKIIYSSNFLRAYKKLPAYIKNKAENIEIVFRKNPFDAALKTHKLNGNLSEFWSFSIDTKYRIIFEIGEKGLFYFHYIGSHEIYS